MSPAGVGVNVFCSPYLFLPFLLFKRHLYTVLHNPHNEWFTGWFVAVTSLRVKPYAFPFLIFSIFTRFCEGFNRSVHSFSW